MAKLRQFFSRTFDLLVEVCLSRGEYQKCSRQKRCSWIKGKDRVVVQQMIVKSRVGFFRSVGLVYPVFFARQCRLHQRLPSNLSGTNLLYHCTRRMGGAL